jgi:phenylpropionate dioxygenase-like ring-hydroxylating dioxygenase large terminal subunit
MLIESGQQRTMTTSPEEKSIIKTVLEYCDSGATHMEAETVLSPVGNYTDPDQLQREIETLFRKFPIIVGHREQLAEPGQYFTHDDTGIPILVTRIRGGNVKAFLNVCRHRGARVANEPCGKANTISCPYHGWTYDLDGKLRGIRQPAGFDQLNKESLGLVEIPAFERFGLIWVRPSAGDDEVDIDAWLQPMAEQLNSIDLHQHIIFREWSIHRDMSWRIALEGFQECYHFCAAHKDTACSAYLDNQSVFINQYPHVRHAVPLAQVAKLGNQDPDTWDYRANFMTQNYLFPCNFIQVMRDHVYVHTIIPTGVGTCVFKCLMLIPEPAVTEKAQKYWEANYKVVRTVFDEDFAIGEGIQKGFAAGANENFIIGRFETSVQLGHKVIDDALEGRLTASS